VSAVLAAAVVAGAAGAGEVPVLPDFDFFVPQPVTVGRPDAGALPPHLGRVDAPGWGRHAGGPAPEAAPAGRVSAPGAAVAPPAAALSTPAGSRAELLQLRQQVLDEMERRAAGG
jgi:hypothetical protein